MYIYLHQYTAHNSSRVLVSTARHPNIDSPDVQLPRHSAVSSCLSYFLAPPTPPFPLKTRVRGVSARVATAWLQLTVLNRK